MFFDSHAHLADDRIFPVVDEVLLRAQATNIDHIVNICTNPLTLERGLELAKRYSWVYNAAATTPHDAEKEGDPVFPIMAEAAREGKLIAVGETGLDYHYWEESKEAQKKLFRRYLHLALETKLPVIIHCRDAFSDFFEIIDAEYKNSPGILHCFTGTQSEAMQVIERGWYLSLSGIVTYKKSLELKEVAKSVPLDKLLLETDSPYLAPQEKRGQQNEPAFLPFTAH